MEDLFLLPLWRPRRTKLPRVPGDRTVDPDDPGHEDRDVSVLGAHKALSPHRVPDKGVLRYHLDLKVPEPMDRCGIRVGAEVRHWEEGEKPDLR